MPLVINALGGVCIYTRRKQETRRTPACGQRALGLKICQSTASLQRVASIQQQYVITMSLGLQE